jgi:hypothetical protein
MATLSIAWISECILLTKALAVDCVWSLLYLKSNVHHDHGHVRISDASNGKCCEMAGRKVWRSVANTSTARQSFNSLANSSTDRQSFNSVAIRRWTDNRSTHLRNLRRPDSLATGRYLYVHTCAYLLSYSLPAKTMPRIYCSTNILRVMVQCLAVKRRKDGRILSILKQSADDGQTNSINFETICLAVERRTEPADR